MALTGRLRTIENATRAIVADSPHGLTLSEIGNALRHMGAVDSVTPVEIWTAVYGKEPAENEFTEELEVASLHDGEFIVVPHAHGSRRQRLTYAYLDSIFGRMADEGIGVIDATSISEYITNQIQQTQQQREAQAPEPTPEPEPVVAPEPEKAPVYVVDKGAQTRWKNKFAKFIAEYKYEPAHTIPTTQITDPRQLYIHENADKMAGEQAFLISNGNLIATIRRVDKRSIPEDTKICATVDGHGSMEYWFDLRDVKLVKDVPASRVSVPKQVDPKVSTFTRLYKHAVDMKKNKEMRLKRRENDIKKSLEDYKKSVKRYTKDLKQAREQLKSLSPTPVDEKTILNELEMINKHALVEEAYLTTKGAIVVITKPLTAFDNKTGKPLENGEVGQMLFRYGLADGDGIRAINLTKLVFDGREDEDARGYDHPNVDNGHICQGSNQIEINAMWEGFQLYLLTDFLVTFFTCFPHDSANPYLAYDRWLEEAIPLNKKQHEYRLKIWKGVKI